MAQRGTVWCAARVSTETLLPIWGSDRMLNSDICDVVLYCAVPLFIEFPNLHAAGTYLVAAVGLDGMHISARQTARTAWNAWYPNLKKEYSERKVVLKCEQALMLEARLGDFGATSREVAPLVSLCRVCSVCGGSDWPPIRPNDIFW